MTSSQLASRTVFIFVKIALVMQVRCQTKKDQHQNCSSSSLKNPQCSAVGEIEVSSDLQSSFHSPTVWACDRVTDSHPPTNEHEGRLCCSRASQAVLQGAPLDCSNETHCSAAWSMAPAGTLLPLGTTAETTRQGHGLVRRKT